MSGMSKAKPATPGAAPHPREGLSAPEAPGRGMAAGSTNTVISKRHGRGFPRIGFG